MWVLGHTDRATHQDVPGLAQNARHHAPALRSVPDPHEMLSTFLRHCLAFLSLPWVPDTGLSSRTTGKGKWPRGLRGPTWLISKFKFGVKS